MIAVLSDIHSNLEALLAVEQDLKAFTPNEIYVLGDIVGYGPNPNECVELVRTLQGKALKGNHERALLQQNFLANFNPLAAKIITWTKDRLNSSNLSYLNSLPAHYRRENTVFVHGSYLDTDKYILESPDIVEEVEELRDMGLKTEFFGHTHMKVIFVEEEKALPPPIDWFTLDEDRIYLINPGSVGQPRDRDTASSYLLYDPEQNRVLYRRIAYDLDLTVEKMKKEGFPPFTYNRLKLGI